MLRFDPSKVTPGTLAQALGIVADLVNRGADWKGVAELPPQEVLDLFTEVEEPGVYRRELTAETVIRNTRPDGTLVIPVEEPESDGPPSPPLAEAPLDYMSQKCDRLKEENAELRANLANVERRLSCGHHYSLDDTYGGCVLCQTFRRRPCLTAITPPRAREEREAFATGKRRPTSLFRRNLPLTRAAIDAARAEDGGQG